MGVLLLSVVILGKILSSKNDKINQFKAESKKQKIVEQSLRDYVGQVASERDIALKDVQQLKIQVSEWQLKYYKCNRNNDDDCEAKISRNNLLNAPDIEQGRILATNALRYASSQAARSGLVVRKPPNKEH